MNELWLRTGDFRRAEKNVAEASRKLEANSALLLWQRGLLSLYKNDMVQLREIVRALRGPNVPEHRLEDHISTLVIQHALCRVRPEEARLLLEQRDPDEHFGAYHCEWMRCHLLLGDRESALDHYGALLQRGPIIYQPAWQPRTR